jgi:signal transduction histidine kinase/CheY-like chemotaxis protein
MLNCHIRRLFPTRRSFRRFVQRHLHVLAAGVVEQVEYQLVKSDGTLIPCTLSGKAITSNSLAKGTVWVIEDISRRKAVEVELDRAREAAEAANIAKGEFLANMSHEIRTPMNGIIGLSNILLSQDMPPFQRENLQLIQRSAVRLMTIINDILDFSKLEAGRFELDQQLFSVRGLLREVIQPIELTAHRKNLQLCVSINPAIPDMLIGDQTKLMQVLTNLIDNSLKFTQKGQINIGVNLERSPTMPSDCLHFSVSDTGIGIPHAYQKNVFESFSQADSTHSRRFGGTGLGLSISKGLVELMGGQIWFVSEPGKGTCFTFTLPAVLPETGVAHAPVRHETRLPGHGQVSSTHNKRILVAEDEYINKILIQTLLQQAGYHVTVVANGRQAVDAWRGGVFDCILMDIQMPEMDGYEAVARIREAEQGQAHIVIIAMTAHAMQGDRQKCLATGMDDYVSKPIDGTLVLQLLHRYLSSASTPESTNEPGGAT